MATGHVSIIGAGPGDPGLISVQGLRLLSLADVVVYDRAVAALLRWARHDAEKIEVGGPAENPMAQDAISMLIADKAREGLTVARLKWGDPFVFDSGGKEALFLHEHRIPFDVVPGVPAAIGASAYAGIPLTHRDHASVVAIATGHQVGEGSPPPLPWDALVQLGGTLVFLMGVRRLGAIHRQEPLEEQFHLHGVHIDLNFTLRCTTNRHRTHTWDTSQWVDHAVVQYLIKCRLTLVGLYR